MSRKKTIEEIREYVESQGYELLSDEYKNNQTKLKIKCKFGHIFLVCWSNFNRDYWTIFYQNLLHEKYGYIYENSEKENYKCSEIQ